ncbi:MAG: hypothetical protein JNL38_06920 [Myxococcales bacterium]|jgi:hypothetical protein|nr:hypothetical protein [Myxococcales bacterium]
MKIDSSIASRLIAALAAVGLLALGSGCAGASPCEGDECAEGEGVKTEVREDAQVDPEGLTLYDRNVVWRCHMLAVDGLTDAEEIRMWSALNCARYSSLF